MAYLKITFRTAYFTLPAGSEYVINRVEKNDM